MEAAHVVGPGLWFRIVPLPAAFGHRQSPVEQVTNVRQNLTRGAATAATIERRESIRSSAHRFGAAIRMGRNRVPQKLTGGISGGGRSRIRRGHNQEIVIRG